MMRKLLTFLLAAAVMLSVCGCDSEKDGNKADESESVVEELSAAEETEAESAVEETKPVKTEKVTVYKEILNIDFSALPDGAPPFSNNAIPDLRIEDGLLKGTSISGDPYAVYSGEFLLNADEVDVVVVKLMNYTSSYNFQMFFTTPEVGWSEPASYHYTLEHGSENGSDNEWNYVTINTHENDLWRDKITCFRLDPYGSEGEFEVAYVAFYQCTEIEVPAE